MLPQPAVAAPPAPTETLSFDGFKPSALFPLRNLQVMTELANLTYQPADVQVKTLASQPGVKSFHVLDTANNAALGLPAPDTGTLVTTVETDGGLLLAVRGTSPEAFLADIKDDTAGRPVNNVNGSGQVRVGFNDAANSIWDQLRPVLQDAIAKHEAINIVGHSLGAAVAILLADRMQNDLKTLPTSVLTAETPGAGRASERTHLDNVGLEPRILRFVHNTDPIPRATPKDPPVGTRVYFDSTGLALVDDKSHKLDILKGEAEHARDHITDPFYDHHLEGIIPLLYDPRNTATFNALTKQMNAIVGTGPQNGKAPAPLSDGGVHPLATHFGRRKPCSS